MSEIAKRSGKCSSSLNKKLIAAFLAAGTVLSVSGSAWADPLDDKYIQINSTGVAASAAGADAIAIGAGALAENTKIVNSSQGYYGDRSNAMAIGINSHADGETTIAIGYGAYAQGLNAMTIGYSVMQKDDEGNELGIGAMGTNAMAIGPQALAKGYNATAIGGQYNRAIGTGATTVGAQAWALADYTTASGYLSRAIGNGSVATGAKSQATGNYSVATGVESQATGNYSVATGAKSQATGNYSVATGEESQATGDNSIATGYYSQATGDNSIATGYYSQATGDNSIATGYYSQATGDNSTANGYYSQASGDNSIASGNYSQAKGAQSVAVGAFANYYGNDSTGTTAIGYLSSVNVPDGVALGSSSFASTAAGTTTEKSGYDPITGEASDKDNATWRSTLGAVSVGSGGTATRQITNVAAGSAETDAVNVAQLKQVAGGLTHYFSVKAKDSGTDSNYNNDGAKGQWAIAIGPYAVATNEDPTKGGSQIAVGAHSYALGDRAIAIGKGVRAEGDNAIAIGTGEFNSSKNKGAYGRNAIAIGENTLVNGNNSTAVGSFSVVKGEESASFGNTSKATADGTTAVGGSSNAISTGASAVGYSSSAGNRSVAIGYGSVAGVTVDEYYIPTGEIEGVERTIAIGALSKATGNRSMAIGAGADATAERSIALGANSVADREKGSYGDADGAYDMSAENNIHDASDESPTWKSTAAAVSVGGGTVDNKIVTRQITNVAAGSAETDAVNVAQLKAAVESVEGVHDYHVKSIRPATDTNYNNTGATGNNALAAGVSAKAQGHYSTVVGDKSEVHSTERTYTVGMKNPVTGETITRTVDQSGVQGVGAVNVGAMNSVGAADDNAYGFDGVANSIVGVANKTEMANGAIIMGAGNVITNSYDDEALKKALEENALALLNEDPEAYRELVKDAGGDVLAIGGANTADYAVKSSMIGVKNTIKGTKDSIEEFNSAIGYNNSIENGSNNSIIGTNRKISGKDGIIVIGSALEKELTTSESNAVVIGTNANVGVEDGVALGSGSITSYKVSESSGYDVRTGDLRTGNDSKTAVWLPTLGEVSVGGNGATRRITNVAAGSNPTDAVNVAQLATSRVEIKAGDNITVATSVAKDGHAIYTLSSSPETVVAEGTNVTVDGPTSSTSDGDNGAGNDATSGGTTESGTYTTNTYTVNAANSKVTEVAVTKGTPSTTGNKTETKYTIAVTSEEQDVKDGKIDPKPVTVTKTDEFTITDVDTKYTAKQETEDGSTTFTVSEVDGEDVGAAKLIAGDNVKITKGEDGSAIISAQGGGGMTEISFNGDNKDAQIDNPKVINIEGGATGELTEGNIGVESDGKDTLTVKLAKDIKGVDSITVNKTINVGDNTTIEDNKITVGNTVIEGDQITTKTVKTGDTTINNDGLTIKNGPSVTKDGIDAGGKKITNVAPGTADNDAATVGQLKNASGDIYNEINRLDNSTRKGIAGAAALAALHPMDFNPDDKLQFSVGVGNYRGETAAAVGMFYRPDESVMFSLGGTFGNSDNMVNAGITFGLDGTRNRITRSRTAMAREIQDLRSLVTQMAARMDRLEGGTNLETAMFPDVPENHWAYEYVEDLQKRGALKGYPDGLFKGDRAMTRYEFAAMLDRLVRSGVTLDSKIAKEFEPELGRIYVERISGQDNDRKKVERVRVNNSDSKYPEGKTRDVYGSKIVTEVPRAAEAK